MKLPKLLGIFIGILASLVLLTTTIHAANTNVNISYEALDDSSQTLKPQVFNENTPRVRITFSNLIPVDHTICTGWGDLFSQGSCDKNYELKVKASEISNGSYSIIVCGGLIHKARPLPDLPALKIDQREHCQNPDDYFHAHSYDLEIKPNGGNKTDGHLKFDVFKPPDLKITFSTTSPKTNESFNMTIAGLRRPGGQERNEYDVKLNGVNVGGMNARDRLNVESGSATANIPGLAKGEYQLDIQIPRDDLSAQCGSNTFDEGWCNIDRLVASYKITVNDTGGSIKETAHGYSYFKGKNPCADPNNPDSPATKCNTAIGEIGNDPTALAQRILTLGLGVAGGIALIFMVYGSIKILTSSGDPKRINDGREIIVAAIAGLLFLIFSVLILRFVGAQLLPTNPF